MPYVQLLVVYFAVKEVTIKAQQYLALQRHTKVMAHELGIHPLEFHVKPELAYTFKAHFLHKYVRAAHMQLRPSVFLHAVEILFTDLPVIPLAGLVQG